MISDDAAANQVVPATPSDLQTPGLTNATVSPLAVLV